MSSRMPPVPPASRSKHGPKRNPEVLKNDKALYEEIESAVKARLDEEKD